MRFLNVLFIAFFVACQPVQETGKVDLKALKNEVFDIHDEVMPKMGDLRRVRKHLMLKADSLERDTTRVKALMEASDRLAAANEGMMAWMRGFEPEFEGTYDETLNYLTTQKEQITQVKKDMLSSLKAGQEMLVER